MMNALLPLSRGSSKKSMIQMLGGRGGSTTTSLLRRSISNHHNLRCIATAATTTSFSFTSNSTTPTLLLHQRYFSSGGKVSSNDDNRNKKDDEVYDDFMAAEDELESWQGRIVSKFLTPQAQKYGLIAGGTFGAYLVSKGFLSLTNFFSHLNPQVVVKYGFYTGFGTATLLGGMSMITLDNLYIRADPVFQYCRRKVQRNRTVLTALGDGIEVGDLRSYRLDAGRFELCKKMSKETKESSEKEESSSLLDKIGMPHFEQVWRPPRIQMIFDITATGPPYRTGLVTCEAIKRTGFPPKLETTLLMVDYEEGEQDVDKTIYIQGNEEQLTRVSSRSGLSLKMLAPHMHISKAIHNAGEANIEGPSGN